MEYVVLAADDEIELLDVLELYMGKEQIKLLKGAAGGGGLRGLGGGSK